MSESYRFDLVDDFTTGTIGQPGQRTFFLQVVAGLDRITFKCEKGHVSALATSLRTVLADLPGDGAPGRTGELLVGAEEWNVGGIGLAYDEDGDRIIIQLEEMLIDEDDDSATARFSITPAMAAGFCHRAEGLVASGRPPCRWCGRPLDPDGHLCPRMN